MAKEAKKAKKAKGANKVAKEPKAKTSKTKAAKTTSSAKTGSDTSSSTDSTGGSPLVLRTIRQGSRNLLKFGSTSSRLPRTILLLFAAVVVVVAVVVKTRMETVWAGRERGLQARGNSVNARYASNHSETKHAAGSGVTPQLLEAEESEPLLRREQNFKLLAGV